ncbi:hypothetical protein IFM89_012115 [Coptis chinensis]|uniref:Uncharacterized protein n=1 Tax=Coptis chinensis TaxID=261450 RepID=A0A835LXS4_9MAGN|nr:hypothetical protein IFM89_012115 [Coptis chinensis]
MASGCMRKGMWLELIGSDGNIAKATIERQNPLVIAIVLLEGTPVSRDFKCNRVIIWVNTLGKVTRVPVVG